MLLSVASGSKTLPPAGDCTAHTRTDDTTEGTRLSWIRTVELPSFLLLDSCSLLLKFAVYVAVLDEFSFPQLLLFLNSTFMYFESLTLLFFLRSENVHLPLNKLLLALSYLLHRLALYC